MDNTQELISVTLEQHNNVNWDHPRSTHIWEPPNGIYIPPINCNPQRLFGNQNNYKKILCEQTKTRIEYNTALKQVEIWGEELSVRKVKGSLQSRWLHINKKEEVKRPKTNKWGKPLDEKEMVRQELARKKLEARQAKLEMLKGEPPTIGVYKSTLIIHESLEPATYFVKYEDFLDSLRMELNVWIVLSVLETLDIIGKKDGVHQAVIRINNFNHQVTYADVKPETLNLLETAPSVETIYLKKLIKHSHLPFDVATIVLLSQAETQEEALVQSSPTNNIQKDQRTANLNSFKNLKSKLSMIRTQSGKFRLRIKFGKIVLTQFPVNLNFPTDVFREKLFNHPKLTSIMSRCMFSNKLEFTQAMNFFSFNGVEFHNSPRTRYTIHSKTLKLLETSNVKLEVAFREDGTINYYNALCNEQPISEINWCFVDPERPYDFQICLDKATLMDQDHPEVKDFVGSLMLENDKRIAYRNTDKMIVTSVVEKNKWLYEYESMIFEFTQAKIWIVEPQKKSPRYQNIIQTVDLSPTYTNFSLTVEKEEWKRALAYHQDLKPGHRVEYDHKALISPSSYAHIVSLAERIILTLANPSSPSSSTVQGDLSQMVDGMAI